MASKPRAGRKVAPPKPRFFATPAAWRQWLERHHDDRDEVWVGIYKKASGRPSVTWPEVVDEALCFGWIDGIRKSLDAERYMNRVTPRRRGSNWSAINVRRVGQLTAAGRMHPAGLRAFGLRTQSKTAIYAYEQSRKSATLPAPYVSRFKAVPGAWEFYRGMPDWYQRTSAWLVISAKREETRLKRLARLIDNCANRRTVAELRDAVLRRQEP